MRIIKPYGRSSTEHGGEALRRTLRLNPDLKKAVDVVAFAQERAELVIAQWISAIDKIAAKPYGNKKPTPKQRDFRQQLGKAALQLLVEKKLIDPKEKRGEHPLEDIWWSKIHPYGGETADKDVNPRGRLRGRWYKRFVGDVEPSEAAVAEVAEKIYAHLHKREYRKQPDRPDKRRGRIQARAASIRDNVLHPPHAAASKWTPADERDYAAAGDVAAEIARKAREVKGPERVSMRTAAPFLFERYGRLFRGEDGKPLSISEARRKFPGLFALHMAVKNTYTRLLKNHKKQSVTHILPKDMSALFRLVKSKSDNRDLTALVRLGKVIHYTPAPSSGAAQPQTVIDHWPADVTHSRYWTSDGQAEIKRNEAFVRVWRHTIALATQTLRDWADPNGRIQRDILSNIKKVTGNEFNADNYGKKLALLFGNRACLFKDEGDAFSKSILRLSLSGWAALRNSSFHFKGRDRFAAALKSDIRNADPAAVDAIRKLWKDDLENRPARLIAALRGAHVERYYEQARLDALTAAVVGAEPSQTPLPRFRRVLDRAKKAWNRKPDILGLPPPGNRSELEKKPGRLCQYIVTKTLYERALPAWLERQSAETLNQWIDRAVDRATNVAQSINKDELAVARAAGLIHLGKKEGIADFFDRLSAATATEMRVQRGYDSDAENARAQAKYLDNLRCDVVGQAFEVFLKDAGLTWVLDELSDALPEQQRRVTARLPKHAGEDVNDWEAVLYLLIHLVPVDAVGRLQHQLRKGSILLRKGSIREGKPSPEADAVQRVFRLYLDMHDAKFEGGEGMTGAEALKSLFAPTEAFRRVCPEQPGQNAGQYVPYRGLREILRFGGRGPLMRIFEKHGITDANVDELEKADASIAEQQKQREELHEKWAKKRKPFSGEDELAYCRALAAVVKHRHLAAHVRLNNHARLHRLLMGVLGRLVDYAGLWERDLYFVTLALIKREQKTPRAVFESKKGRAGLKNGRIVKAIRDLQGQAESSDGWAIFNQLKGLFGEHFFDTGQEKNSVAIRDDLMHFNMMQDKTKPLNLTEAVNQTRRLMAYDRKLKNAVSQSIKEMLAREGLDLTWTMQDHQLSSATIKPRQAVHLERKRIRESLHGEAFVAMAATLFGGKPLSSDDDVCSIDKKEALPSPRSSKGGEKNRPKRRGNRRRKGRFSGRKR